MVSVPVQQAIFLLALTTIFVAEVGEFGLAKKIREYLNTKYKHDPNSRVRCYRLLAFFIL